jgi:hypothetical protein
MTCITPGKRRQPLANLAREPGKTEYGEESGNRFEVCRTVCVSVSMGNLTETFVFLRLCNDIH